MWQTETGEWGKARAGRRCLLLGGLVCYRKFLDYVTFALNYLLFIITTQGGKGYCFCAARSKCEII